MFLTPADLFVLTGYKLPAKQIRWLESHGYPHDVNAAGRPVDLADTVKRRHGLVEDSLIDWGKVA